MDTSLYHHELLDHYRNPRNRGRLEKHDIITTSCNPSCGDSIALYVRWDSDHLDAIRFEGKGCVISQAAASLLTEFCSGKSRSFLRALTKDDVLRLVGIPLGPTRLRCALISLDALHAACRYESVTIKRAVDAR